MSIEVMKLALEALEDCRSGCLTKYDGDKAITALRQAIEEAEQAQPVAFYVYKPTLPRGNLGNVSDGDLPWVYDQDPSSGYSARMLVYTTPPQRKPWVGLTDKERFELAVETGAMSADWLPFMEAVEIALKDKNK